MIALISNSREGCANVLYMCTVRVHKKEPGHRFLNIMAEYAAVLFFCSSITIIIDV